MSLSLTSWRILVAAAKHVSRNVWLALTTVFVLTLSLLSVNVLVGVNVLLDRSVQSLEEKIDVSVYFKEHTPQAILDHAKFFMTSLPQVSSVELLTAERALDEFRKRHAQEPKILAALGELEKNPLGATLVIKAKRPSDYPFLLEALNNPQFNFAIESKNYEDHAETIARVRELGASARLFGLGLISVFAIVSILIVFNTIRIAIYTQREEIGVMRLVGASSAFVRIPFVLEGVFLATTAFVFTAILVLTASAYADPRLARFFGTSTAGLSAYFFSHAPTLLLVEGGGLALLVAVSSWAAVGKYLRR